MIKNQQEVCLFCKWCILKKLKDYHKGKNLPFQKEARNNKTRALTMWKAERMEQGTGETAERQ